LYFDKAFIFHVWKGQKQLYLICFMLLSFGAMNLMNIIISILCNVYRCSIADVMDHNSCC
jgi:hypothetical protein